MKKVLLAGGAGFVGSHLAENLVKKGYEVTIVDDLSSGRFSNIESISGKIKFIESDVRELDFKGQADYVLNLASRASRNEWEKYPVEVALSNSEGSNNLIKIALQNHARYIFVSSSEIYGNAEVIPTPESYVGKVSTTGTRSPYDEGKRFGESLAKAYERQHGLDSVIVRLFNTYGPRMRGGDFYGRVIDRFVEQALSGKNLTVYGDGSQTRSFTYATDTADAIACLMEHAKKGSVFNIGSGEETRIIDLARSVIRLSGSVSEIEFMPLPEGDPERTSADTSAIKSMGWSPQIGLKEGLLMTIRYYRSR